MGVTFTKEQQQVIDLRDRNILVSAAAGSGKTAVLVERIITRLTKDTSPIDVDRLLVVTYTEAAAAEMKERIRSAIEKALEENPSDAHLQRQATLVHQAKVTTIHSFCLSVIRDYFHTIDLDPGFRIGEDGELKLLQQDVLDEVLECWYEEARPDFLYFVEGFATGRDDRRIGDIILKMYEYSRSYPNPEEWLSDCVKFYGISSVDELEKASFVRKLLEEVHEILRDVEASLNFAKAVCCEEDGPKAYLDAIESDLLLLSKLCHVNSFGQMQEILSELEWKSLKRNTDKMVSAVKIELVKNLRNECKDMINDLRSNYFYEDANRILENMNAAKSNMEVLTELVKSFASAYAEKKQEKNIIDYSDMEHYALQILTREENGKREPSSAAKEYQEKFAEIMIDEYQDSNYVQEAILTSVSTVSHGKHNIFMVGDVKQSIYRFRLARPELFMEKYHTYSEEDAQCQRIDLHKNFRSRREVLDSTNYIFRQIMTSGFGGIEYDDKAALYVGAAYEEQSENETEVLLIDVSERTEGLNTREIEALAIAQRIKELVGHHPVLDKKTGGYRKARYEDIVILTRSIKGWTDVFLRVLKEEGIPAYSISKEGYFEAREIQMLLDYLRVLDNPRQDIPFVATLCSPFAGITAEELAMIKSDTKGKTFYERTLCYLEKGEQVSLKEKIQKFMEQLEAFRRKVPYTSMHNLLWQILDDTGYGNYVASLPAGEQRAANLEMLIEKAISFESTSYKGLFHFVRYIEQLKKYNVDYGEANIQEETSDVVSLMSIHKSKGLEFPIVFVAGMEKKFNLQDTSDSVVLHSELGAGIDFVDVETREKYPTLLRRIIQNEVQKESVAEELRVLYVAMTRAKEKLILTGAISNPPKRMADCSSLKHRGEVALPYTRLAGARKYFDWVLPALYRNQLMSPVLETYEMESPWQNPLFHTNVPMIAEVVDMETMMCDAWEEVCEDEVTRHFLQEWNTETIYDENLKAHLMEQFEYSYPYAEKGRIKPKVSVSELKKRVYLEAEEYQEEVALPLIPKFLQKETEFTGATRGTAYHRVLELLDFRADYDDEKLKNAIRHMVQQNLLTEEMADCVTISDILTFLESSVAKRMKKASEKGLFYTEQPFVLGDEELASELILVQGIIDVYFEEDGELVILDYKTDKVRREEELRERYLVQLEYYAKVLSKVTGKRVKEKIIYSFTLQKEIEVK